MAALPINCTSRKRSEYRCSHFPVFGNRYFNSPPKSAGYFIAQRAGHHFTALSAQLSPRELTAGKVQQVVKLNLTVIVFHFCPHLHVEEVAVPLAKIGPLRRGLRPVVKTWNLEPHEDS
jgi:hypothetical protein